MGNEGLVPDDAVLIARALKERGADFIDVSSGGNVAEQRPEYGRMYQVPFAEAVRYGARVPVIAVGNIQGTDHANTVLASGRADLVALAPRAPVRTRTSASTRAGRGRRHRSTGRTRASLVKPQRKR